MMETVFSSESSLDSLIQINKMQEIDDEVDQAGSAFARHEFFNGLLKFLNNCHLGRGGKSIL